MNNRFEPKVTDEEIALYLNQRFGVPVLYSFHPENDSVPTSDFIMYAPTKILPRTEERKYLMQQMHFMHVAVFRPEGFEFEMYEALQELGLLIQEVEYERVPLTDNMNMADVLLFTVTRRIKDNDPSKVNRRIEKSAP